MQRPEPETLLALTASTLLTIALVLGIAGYVQFCG